MYNNRFSFTGSNLFIFFSDEQEDEDAIVNRISYV